jgi:hypothetical protein
MSNRTSNAQSNARQNESAAFFNPGLFCDNCFIENVDVMLRHASKHLETQTTITIIHIYFTRSVAEFDRLLVLQRHRLSI